MMKHRLSAVILAGGASRRMGKNKALLPLGEKKMIQWVVDALDRIFDELILVTHQPQTLSVIENAIFVQDEMDTGERNALVGIYSGLLHASNDTAFVVPCDMPLLNRGIIEHMIQLLDGEDVRVPMTGPHLQPLHAFYGKSCLPFMQRALGQRQYKLTAFYDDLLVRTVDEKSLRYYDPELISFTNVNGPEKYEEICRKWPIYEKHWHRQWTESGNEMRKKGRRQPYVLRRSVGY